MPLALISLTRWPATNILPASSPAGAEVLLLAPAAACSQRDDVGDLAGDCATSSPSRADQRCSGSCPVPACPSAAATVGSCGLLGSFPYQRRSCTGSMPGSPALALRQRLGRRWRCRRLCAAADQRRGCPRPAPMTSSARQIGFRWLREILFPAPRICPNQ